jgi:putative FmdB family regulatory protein
MPLYEYYCEPCNGIFEELQPMRDMSPNMPCPECYKDAERIMPTSFAAFTFRDGMPRRIPDDGKFYHLGKKVSTRVTHGRANEHPEVNKPKPKPRKTKGEKSAINDMKELAAKKQLVDSSGIEVPVREVVEKYERRDILKKGTPR